VVPADARRASSSTTYRARALAGLIARVAGGGIKREDRTVFMHTGGLPGLFGHPDFRA
jgi:L-cysteate sulfo-lyase